MILVQARVSVHRTDGTFVLTEPKLLRLICLKPGDLP